MKHVGFEVLTAMLMKNPVIWDVTLCSSLKDNQCFRGIYQNHLQGCIAVPATCFHAGVWHDLFFDREDAGCIFLQNVG
jgi:hypothetical protein